MTVALPFLGSCTSFELVTEFTKERPIFDQNGPVASDGTHYKIGLPYRINGTTYYPKVDYDYEEVGMASWYGESFHERKTANGAIFHMHAVSAAHRTLPLPSLVEVENLSNGRKLVVKVNDRGPFHSNRILDLSMRAAELLGFKNKGVAKIRIKILAEESRRLAAKMQDQKTLVAAAEPKPSEVSLIRVDDGTKDVTEQVVIAPLKKLVGTQTNADILIPPREGVYVQVAAFSKFQFAMMVRKKVSGYTSTIGLVPQLNGGSAQIYKVLVGPFIDIAAAAQARNHLLRQDFPGAHLITWRS